MTLDPFLAAPQPIPVHAIAALVAMVLDGLQLWEPKGTRNHRTLGYIWVGLMAIVAFSGFFIHGLKLVRPFSPIHLLSVLTLASLWYAIRAARRGDIKRHCQTMVALFWMALILAGFFIFWPGWVMYQVVTGA
tara:strand:+ start:78 stop:476 length:399 start_codon:yes stop_codon:yes gene_type:complete